MSQLHSVSAAPNASLREVWGPVTIRVAWVLYHANRSTTRDLVDAREHVLLSLPQNVHPAQAEELAERYTLEYLDRKTQGNYTKKPVETCGIEPQYRWRGRLLDVLDSVGELVFRLGYGDQLSIEHIAETLGADSGVVASSKEGIRGALRAILDSEGVSLANGENKQIDILLSRLALLATPDCSGGDEILRSDKRGHVEHCPRCTRGLRLIRANQLAPSDLIPPNEQWTPPNTSVIAIHFHPDSRHRRNGVLAALDGRAFLADNDVLLVDPDHVPDLGERLHELLLHGKPKKTHIRGALVRGGGRWSEGALLGPVADAAMKKTLSQQWGHIDSIDSLPEPLPEPPSPTRWWVAAMLVTLLAILGGVLVLQSPTTFATYPVDVEYGVSKGELYTRFDAHDQALMSVVSHGVRGLRVEHHSQSPADKGILATGKGDFALRIVGQGPQTSLLIASNPQHMAELERFIEMSAQQFNPLDELQALLKRRYPQADIKLHRLP